MSNPNPTPQPSYDDDNTFDPFEANDVVRDYVCAVCNGQLVQHYLAGDRRILVVCPEHGNVTVCGRVTRNTVSIELENSARKYAHVIRNLPDLWGELIPPKKSTEKALKDLGFE